MATASLFERKSSFGGIYVMVMVNRLQMLFMILIIPMYLVHPYMIWGIVAMGVLSQINLIVLSKWFSSGVAAKGYLGFAALFGERAVRCFAFIGLFAVLINITSITPGYVEIVRHFVFPSMSANWLILFFLLISWYVAAKGIENTIRFVLIAFFATVWMILLFVPFYFPPIASLRDLYPLLPAEWTEHSWRSLLFIWSSLSGPEYLVFLGPWLQPQQKMLKYLTIANALSVAEYLIIFIASLLFFGSNYLSISAFPVVNMIRYLQSPIFERIDIILLCVHMFHFVFALAMYLLFFYGAARIAWGRVPDQPSQFGLMLSLATILVCSFVINEWFWKSDPEQNIWFTIQIWVGALTYLLVPAILVMAMKRKEAA